MKKTKKKIKKNKILKKKSVNKSKNLKKTKKKYKKNLKFNIKKKKKSKSKLKKSIFKKKSKKFNKIKIKETNNQSFLLKLINFQNSLKPDINFKFNFGLEKYIQAFFDKIANTIFQYRVLKKDEARRLKLENIEKERL